MWVEIMFFPKIWSTMSLGGSVMNIACGWGLNYSRSKLSPLEMWRIMKHTTRFLTTHWYLNKKITNIFQKSKGALVSIKSWSFTCIENPFEVIKNVSLFILALSQSSHVVENNFYSKKQKKTNLHSLQC